ncbi:MAG: regulator of sigma protease [Blastocatellia bacterium]|jgi:membrane-associated protease RseP (regulator of RpoE activity)|nr:regulator of sigma protease [Blastocatellia bacterium]
MLITYLICFATAMLIHELGHLFAANVCRVPALELGLGWGRRLCGFRLGQVEYKLHLLPVGAYVRLDMKVFQERPLSQQSFILLAGIIVNLLAAVLTEGTSFSLMNLLLAATNLLPLYQQDGWKCGMVLLRAIMRRKSALVEWTFTITGSLLSVALLIAQALRYRSF